MIKDILCPDRAGDAPRDRCFDLPGQNLRRPLDAVALGYVSTGNVASLFTEVRLLPLPLISRETH
jgi:hypothetical protein